MRVLIYYFKISFQHPGYFSRKFKLIFFCLQILHHHLKLHHYRFQLIICLNLIFEIHSALFIHLINYCLLDSKFINFMDQFYFIDHRFTGFSQFSKRIFSDLYLPWLKIILQFFFLFLQ